MSYFAIRVPSKMPAVVYTIKEKFNFSRHGYIYRDYIQHTLIDFLINNAQNSQNKEVYEKILSEVLPSFLKIEFNEDEGNGRTITLYTFHLSLSESIKDFRQKCFNFLLFSANKTTVLNVLYRLNYYEYTNSKEILQHDLPFLYQIISKHFNGDNFEDCFVLQNITEGLDWLNVDYTNEIKNKYNSKLFQLAEVLKSDRRRIHELSIEEEEKRHQKELQDYCDGFSIDNYFILLSDISSILDYVKKGNLEWQYEHSLKTIFGNLAQGDSTLFIEVLKLNFNKFHFNLNYIYIFNIFFQFNPQFYFELFEQIRSLENYIKFSYHQTIRIEVVKKEHLFLLYEDLVNSIKSLDSQYFFWDLTFVSKYKKIKNESDVYSEILDVILTKNKEEDVRISAGKHFIKKCIELDSFPISKIIEAYLYSERFERHFDYDKKLLRRIIELDSNIIIQLLKFSSPHRLSYHDLEHKNFDFIWELDNYLEIIDSIFEYFINTEAFSFAERAIASFFPVSVKKHGDRPLKYLETLIDEKSQDDIYMNVVFSIVCYKYPEQKMSFLERFLKLNIVFENFRSLEIIQRNKSWSGSYIPILENEKEIWQNVISVIDRLPNRLDYYEHKEYATMQIGYCDLRIREEMKREFYEEDR